MKRFAACLLTLSLALSLSACKKVDDQPTPDSPVSAAPTEVETPAEGFTTVTGDAFAPTNLKSVSASAVKTEGRIPGGEYVLPEEVTEIIDWEDWGGVGLLAEIPEADAAFYAVEGKDFSPALIRWGDSLAEFDWRYATPRNIAPRMWCFDFDEDGLDELVVDCYYGSGTGVSLSDLHVVEKDAEGNLTAYTFPLEALAVALESDMGIVTAGETVCAYLGTELVDITAALGDLQPRYTGSGLALGETVGFEKTEAGMACRMGAVVDAEKLHHWYAADITADVFYKDGEFILDGLHLDGY